MSFEDVKSYFKTISIPMIAFCALTAKCLLTGFDLPSAVASFAFAGVYCFKLWLKHLRPDVQKVDISKELQEKVQQLENQITVIKLNSGIKNLRPGTYEEKR